MLEVDMANTPTIERLRAEFMEMPGLRLTAAQIERLCGVERTICKPVLEALVDARFLRVSADGMYVRVTDGAVPRPRAAKIEDARLLGKRRRSLAS
jgi:hypothetical protein